MKVLHEDENQGKSAAANRALAAAGGELIAWLDADDVMLPGKLSAQVALLERRPDAVGCCHDAEVFDSDTGRVLGPFSQIYNGRPLREGGIELWFDPTYRSLPSATMFRASAAPPHGLDTGLRRANDWLFDIEVFRDGTCAVIPDALVRYRRHADQMTSERLRSEWFEEGLQVMDIVQERYPELRPRARASRAALLLGESRRLAAAGHRREAMRRAVEAGRAGGPGRAGARGRPRAPRLAPAAKRRRCGRPRAPRRPRMSDPARKPPRRRDPVTTRTAGPDLVEMLPRPIGRVLEVGCGAGAVLGQLREEGAEGLVGIEPEPGGGAAGPERRRPRPGDYGREALDELEGPFDTIICHDVLEHLVDPWQVLGRLSEIAAPGGRIQVSVPNARHISLVLDLVFKGTFGYTDFAHRDITHLRWFTRKDIVAAVTSAGWRVTATGNSRLSRPRRALDRLTFGLSTEFLVLQWYVVATRD